MNALATASMYFRPDFIGATDRYSPLASSPVQPRSSIQRAMDGIAPFDVVGDLLNDGYMDAAAIRLERYRNAWNYYNGDHFQQMFEDGERKVVCNYCATIVDKGVDWFLAKGFTIRGKEGNEDAAEFLMSIFRGNQYLAKFYKGLQFGAITGDAFFYVTVETKDVKGNDLPKDQWRVRFDALNPAHCFPFWSSSNPDQLLSILIQFPVTLEQGQPTQLFSLYITPDTFESWVGFESQGKKPNPFGKVNVVHIPNFSRADSFFGKSDIEGVMPLNDELNVVATSIRRIIKYHAEPTTIIYGARVTQLEKGSKKVWSGLPAPTEAKVENLQMEGDLAATYQWYAELKKEISVHGETPAVMLAHEDARISNTSGIAIELLFEPIISKTNRRRTNYQKGISAICDLIFIATEKIIGEDISILADKPEDLKEVVTDFTSPLPKDEQMQLDIALKKISAGIWSQVEGIRQCSGVLDLQRLTLELAADTRAKLALARENQRAVMNEDPIMSVAFLGSPFLFVDLDDLAEQSNPSTSSGANQSGA